MFNSLKVTPHSLREKFFLSVLFILICGVAFGSSVGEDVDRFINTYDKINNRYFHAVLLLWPAMLFGAAKLRQGQKLAPPMARALAVTMLAINAVCILFLVIHFSPDTSVVIEYIVGIFERIF
jgi:hypothetical protein